MNSGRALDPVFERLAGTFNCQLPFGNLLGFSVGRLGIYCPITALKTGEIRTKQITMGWNGKAILLLKTLLFSGLSGAGDGTRTRNLLITNQLLYQLSYAGKNTYVIDNDRV